MTGEPLEPVTLIEEELVLRRGASVVSWLVRKNDGWIRARAVPGARSEALDRGAGVVFRYRVELALPRGTRLVRVETRPDERRASTLEHLTGSTRGARRKTVRTEFRVEAGGRIAPLSGRSTRD